MLILKEDDVSQKYLKGHTSNNTFYDILQFQISLECPRNRLDTNNTNESFIQPNLLQSVGKVFFLPSFPVLL
jgi:hypothetical protein